MNETLGKGAVLVLTLLIVGFMAAIIFVPGAMEVSGDVAEGAMTALQDIGNAVSKVIFK